MIAIPNTSTPFSYSTGTCIWVYCPATPICSICSTIVSILEDRCNRNSFSNSNSLSYSVAPMMKLIYRHSVPGPYLDRIRVYSGKRDFSPIIILILILAPKWSSNDDQHDHILIRSEIYRTNTYGIICVYHLFSSF